MDEKNLVVLRVYDSINEAEWDRSLLESQGVWAMINNEAMSALFPTGVIPAQLIIRPNDKERATEILNAYSSQ